ncbi:MULTISPECIES: hypothetical protein [unclassified Paenibacillus]|uniref:hypothetical protein n=1 Tax=unclassified Paenibacillus TaxID=185978 RepID=UPI0036D2CF41
MSFLIRVIHLCRNEKIQRVLDIFRAISLFAFIGGAFSFYFFTLSFSFLYGYYFSGNEANTYQSLLSLSISPVVFNFHSLLIISLLIGLAVTYILSAASLVKKGGWQTRLSIVIFSIGFHISLSIFFVDGTDIGQKVLGFLIIWVVPVFISVMLFWSYRSLLSFGNGFSGAVYGIVIYSMIKVFFGNWSSLDQLLVPLTAFLTGTIFTYFQKSCYRYYLYRVIINWPYFFVAVYIMDTTFASEKYLMWLFIGSIILAFVSGVWKPKLNLNTLSVNQENSNEGDGNQNDKLFRSEQYLNSLKEQGKAKILTSLSIIIIVVGTLTPSLASLGGQYIRDFTAEEPRKLQTIRDYKNNQTILGKVVVIKDGFYYISNQNWELEILNSDSAYVNNVPIQESK